MGSLQQQSKLLERNLKQRQDLVSRKRHSHQHKKIKKTYTDLFDEMMDSVSNSGRYSELSEAGGGRIKGSLWEDRVKNRKFSCSIYEEK